MLYEIERDLLKDAGYYDEPDQCPSCGDEEVPLTPITYKCQPCSAMVS